MEWVRGRAAQSALQGRTALGDILVCDAIFGLIMRRAIIVGRCRHRVRLVVVKRDRVSVAES